MTAYEFYWFDPKGGRQVISVLPERRKHPERSTKESIANWGKKFFGKTLDTKDIYFIQITIDDDTGRIFRPTPFSSPCKEISE